ncbi:unnamed protein product [Blepharisma stoltei]|uniref:RanBP2-type domain-containing protein n=1 Tax=Blepharisma stoltei TaxID=1481888 RepID=A0AAU9JLB4_9CILI|nr:unnamed protein product [Blepharisma stoltei]
MSEQSQKISYPNAIKKRVDGDWNCPNCSNLNFSFRSTCNRCGYTEKLMPTFNAFLYMSAPSLEETSAISCDAENPPPRLDFSQLPSISPFLREKCLQARIEINPVTKRCLKFDNEVAKEDKSNENTPNPKPKTKTKAKKHKKSGSLTVHIKKPAREKEGDWICLKCNNWNFAFRSECNICKESKEK